MFYSCHGVWSAYLDDLCPCMWGAKPKFAYINQHHDFTSVVGRSAILDATLLKQ